MRSNNEIERLTIGTGEAAHTVIFTYAEDSSHLDPTDRGNDEAWNGFTFVTFERNSTLSDRHEFSDFEEMLEHVKDAAGAVIMFPLYGYRHGDVSYRIGALGNPFSCKWDSGLAGAILVDRRWAEANLRTDQPFDDVVRHNAELFAELVTNWCNGTAYEMRIEDADGNRVDDDADIDNAVLGFVDEDARRQASAEAAILVAQKLKSLASEATACRATISSNRRAALALLRTRRTVPEVLGVPSLMDAIRTNVRNYLGSICAARNRLKELPA